MKPKFIQKLSAILTAGCLLVAALPVFAAASNIEVVFTDVTATDTTTLSGEAKIMVSVKGAGGNVSIAQTALAFSGDLNYKSIHFLQGQDDPDNGYTFISPNSASVNSEKKLIPSIIAAKTPLTFTDDTTDLFVLTFSGSAGDTVTLSMTDFEGTYCTVDGTDVKPSDSSQITVAASSEANESKTATVRLTMDQVTDFTTGGNTKYPDSGVTLKITSETTSGYTISTVLGDAHRDNTTIPTFTVTNEVLASDTYTVEISGIGYITYRQTGVTFDEALEITNADFIPGDVYPDGAVDSTDKQLCESAIETGEYNEAADFNRDGVVDQYDLAIFDNIPDDDDDDDVVEGAPAKMATPVVRGGSNQITVSWAKLDDDSVTGYIITYGTRVDALTSSREITDPDTTSATITGLTAGTTYYVRIAAKNEVGTGTASNLASASTTATSGGGTGGGNSGGNSGGNNTGGNTGTVISGGNNTGGTTIENETFTDLGGYDWAKDSIYTLKNMGIINGVTETTYSPSSNIKRGDFMLILTRMLTINDAFTENFADVPVGSYYYDAIGSAKVAGIALGSGENFMPDNSITRQDLITLAYRAFLNAGYITEATDTTSLDVFADKDSISEYALTSMASMVAAGIIQGNDGNVNPLGNATRAEVAVMCARLVALMN